MNETILTHFDTEIEFLDCLETAEEEAKTSWEMDVVSTMTQRYNTFGKKMYLSEKQAAIIKRIAKQ